MHQQGKCGSSTGSASETRASEQGNPALEFIFHPSQPDNGSKLPLITRHTEAIVVQVSPLQTRFCNTEKASSYLMNERWKKAVEDSLDSKSNNTILEVDQSLLDRADLLQKQLEQRLVRHCQIRIAKEEKRNHWCLRWAARNLPQVAAIMCLFNHIKPDLSCLDNNQCLLAATSAFLRATSNVEARMEGCYLYYDLNNEEWIRSGKAIGSNFGTRHKQHQLGSMLKGPASQKSKFYSSYPSKSVQLADASCRKGVFENLQMLVGIGYDKLLATKLIHDHDSKNGIFHFDSETMKKIEAVNFPGIARNKPYHMLGYLWELAYDLCIAPGSNISGNPGFETVLGIY